MFEFDPSRVEHLTFQDYYQTDYLMKIHHTNDEFSSDVTFFLSEIDAKLVFSMSEYQIKSMYLITPDTIIYLDFCDDEKILTIDTLKKIIEFDTFLKANQFLQIEYDYQRILGFDNDMFQHYLINCSIHEDSITVSILKNRIMIEYHEFNLFDQESFSTSMNEIIESIINNIHVSKFGQCLISAGYHECLSETRAKSYQSICIISDDIEIKINCTFSAFAPDIFLFDIKKNNKMIENYIYNKECKTSFEDFVDKIDYIVWNRSWDMDDCA